MIRLERIQQDDVLRLSLQGNWVLAEAVAIRTALLAVSPVARGKLLVDASRADSLDVTAAWMVFHQVQQWRQQGCEVGFGHFPEEYLAYFTRAAEKRTVGQAHKPRAFTGIRQLFWQIARNTGARLFALGGILHSAITFFGHSFVALFTSLLSPGVFRFRSVFHHIFATGISAVPIVALIACLISIVITYQGGGQLRDLGAELYTVDMVTISVLRELGVLLTAIMVAGRSGSAFAAEIGLMKTNQEVDALRVMGKDPFLILVVPRMVALVIALPLLTLIADIVALAAAAVISSTILDISFVQFFTRVETNIEFHTFAAGLVKAPPFAVVIALIGCWQGMRVTGSSESLGKHTTKAVVDAIFLVLVLDALFSVVFYKLGF
jgi:phospholipid/cholesterol/gamma-HCH transport system permease protein